MGDLELSAAEFQALYERLRGQAQWGSDDRRGALNHITPPRLLAAAGEVQLGRSVTMASPVAGSAPDNPEPAARPHRIAIGLIGDPVPPGNRSGAMTHRKDQRPAAWHTASRSSNCR